jgi:hypothetical protein
MNYLNLVGDPLNQELVQSRGNAVDDDPDLLNFATTVSWIVGWMSFPP